jgi:hypothetical protein
MDSPAPVSLHDEIDPHESPACPPAPAKSIAHPRRFVETATAELAAAERTAEWLVTERAVPADAAEMVEAAEARPRRRRVVAWVARCVVEAAGLTHLVARVARHLGPRLGPPVALAVIVGNALTV